MHYTLFSFLRAMPNTLLARYFKQRAIDLEIDVGALKAREVEPIATALEQLDRAVTNRIETEFQQVHEMACEGGAKALHQELAEIGKALPEAPDRRRTSLLTIAMSVLLEEPEAFRTAMLFRPYFDQGRYWRRVNDLPFKMPPDPKEASKTLAECLKAYYRDNEGRGRNCWVEHYQRAERHFFFAFPEDYPQAQQEWASGQLETRTVRPAFDLVFVVTDGASMSLDTCVRAQWRETQELSNAFAEVLFDRAIPPENHSKSSYDLEPLKRRAFAFAIPPGSSIKHMFVRKLKFRVAGTNEFKLTFEANIDCPAGQSALYDAIDCAFATDTTATTDRIPYTLARPIWAELVVYFHAEGRRGKRRQPVTISLPSSCSLKHDGEDLAIREILVRSGIQVPPKGSPDERQVA